MSVRGWEVGEGSNELQTSPQYTDKSENTFGGPRDVARHGLGA